MGNKNTGDRKSEIVNGMYGAIERHGIDLPSFEQVSQVAGMTRQLIRHYYSESEEIALELCDSLAAQYRDSLMKGILSADKKGRLDVFLDFFFDFLSEQGIPKPRDDQVYDAMFAFAATSDAVRKNLYDQYSLLQMTLAHEIQLTHPKLSQDSCRELGFLIVINMYGHWKMVASLGFNEDYKRVTRDSLDRVIHSYVEREPGEAP